MFVRGSKIFIGGLARETTSGNCIFTCFSRIEVKVSVEIFIANDIFSFIYEGNLV